MTVRNRTIFTADNLHVMRGMADESVDLIYLDPPFNSKHDYAAPVGSKAAGAEFKDIWTLDDVDLAWWGEIADEYPGLYRVLEATREIAGKSMMSYLIYMAIRIIEMHRILKPTGSLYLHCDPTASHYLKLVLDAVFGTTGFFADITWKRSFAHNDKMFGSLSDNILYSSGRKFVGLSTIFFSRTYLLRDQATPMTNTSTVLKKALKKEKDARVSLRIVAVNMVAVQGQRVDDVAQSLMMSDDWVRQWVDRYESGGLDALRDRPRAGRPPKVRKDKLNKIIDDASRKRVRPHEVSDAIKRKTGVGYSSRHVLRLMRGRNLSPKKIQYVHVNHASPAAVSKWQKRERRVIAYHRRKGRTVGWGDESHHRRDDKSNALFWTEQGTPVSGTFTNDPQKVSAHGLLLEDTRHMVRLYDRANSDTFIDFLKEAHRRFGPLLIYEDRASYHQSRKVQEFLRDNPEIVLRYTPVGSPYVNPAEHMWLVKSRSSVSYKYHASFEDFCKDLSEHYRTVHYNIDPIKCMSQRPKRYAKF